MRKKNFFFCVKFFFLFWKSITHTNTHTHGLLLLFFFIFFSLTLSSFFSLCGSLVCDKLIWICGPYPTMVLDWMLSHGKMRKVLWHEGIFSRSRSCAPVFNNFLSISSLTRACAKFMKNDAWIDLGAFAFGWFSSWAFFAVVCLFLFPIACERWRDLMDMRSCMHTIYLSYNGHVLSAHTLSCRILWGFPRINFAHNWRFKNRKFRQLTSRAELLLMRYADKIIPEIPV
jgi:hypothetical protein